MSSIFLRILRTLSGVSSNVRNEGRASIRQVLALRMLMNLRFGCGGSSANSVHTEVGHTIFNVWHLEQHLMFTLTFMPVAVGQFADCAQVMLRNKEAFRWIAWITL